LGRSEKDLKIRGKQRFLDPRDGERERDENHNKQLQHQHMFLLFTSSALKSQKFETTKISKAIVKEETLR